MSHTREDYQNVLYDIFTTKEYNKFVFPRLNSTEPVYIDVSLHFMRIEEIDEKNEKMISTGYLEIIWQDPGLRWDSEHYGNIQQVYIQQNEMWIPDIFLVNRAGQFSGFGGSFYPSEPNIRTLKVQRAIATGSTCNLANSSH